MSHLEFTAVYIPFGVGTFHMESAQDLFERSSSAVREVLGEEHVIVPAEKILSIAALSEYLDTLEPEKTDLIILQNLTFANAAYTYEVLRRFSVAPILLWTLQEPVRGDGGRLRLNSLTGAFSAGNAIRAFRDGEHPFEYVIGTPEDDSVRAALRDLAAAAAVKRHLRSVRLAQVGHTPEGFGFGRALDQEITAAFGSVVESIEARELIDIAKKTSDEEAREYLTRAGKWLRGLENTPEKNVKDFARLYKAYSEYVTGHGIAALASRCWPDFFTDFGTPVCAVLSLLNAEGTAASCESDLYGALSMLIAGLLTESATFFGDPVCVSDEENTITFWHCGMAACSLAREDNACVGVHPNRKIGPTMEFGCKASPSATIFRVGRKKDGSFRFFVAEGEILDRPRQFLGTSLVVQTKKSAQEIVEGAVKDGWEPHYVVAYGDCANALTILGHLYDIPVIRY